MREPSLRLHVNSTDELFAWTTSYEPNRTLNDPQSRRFMWSGGGVTGVCVDWGRAERPSRSGATPLTPRGAP